MIPRYNRPQIEKIWSLENKFKIWTEIECLIAEKQALLGIIPKKAACLIDASTYKVKISRIDICQKNPFPNYRITPDYGESNCINLLDKKISKNYDLNKLKIPTNTFIKTKNHK